jgi:hypothetical protein
MQSAMTSYVRAGVITALGLGLWMLAGTSSAACLQKTVSGNAIRSTYVFMLAPESTVAVYVALGFSRIDCPSDMSVFRAYVTQICGGNGGAPYPPLNTDLAIGVPRAQACADAKSGLAEAGG